MNKSQITHNKNIVEASILIFIQITAEAAQCDHFVPEHLLSQ
jgi:hypothetical protein